MRLAVPLVGLTVIVVLAALVLVDAIAPGVLLLAVALLAMLLIFAEWGGPWHRDVLAESRWSRRASPRRPS